jgi:hypothetical protein
MAVPTFYVALEFGIRKIKKGSSIEAAEMKLFRFVKG